MRKIYLTRRVINAAGLLLCGLLFSTGALAAGSYLQELEAEAATIDNTPQPAQQANSSNWPQQQATAKENIDPGLSKAQFEESLKQYFYGSYIFYESLNDSKRQVVFQEYRTNNDIGHLRDVIKAQLIK